MTARNGSGNIGLRVGYAVREIVVYCKIVDAKSSYGVERVQIKPESGEGLMWVNADSVRVVEK